MRETESIVMCEGWHDRAFWNGLLQFCGCTSLRPPDGKGPPRDPWGKAVVAGNFAFSNPAGHFIRIMPVQQLGAPIDRTALRLAQVQTASVQRIIVCGDTDTNHLRKPTVLAVEREGALRDNLSRHLNGDSFSVTRTGADVCVNVGGEATFVNFVDWSSDVADGPGIPRQHTLERLVCAAILQAHPQRGPSVQTWLDSRPQPPAPVSPKAFSGSYMAGWFSDRGSESFYEAIWQDAAIASALKLSLESQEVWPIVEQLIAGE